MAQTDTAGAGGTTTGGTTTPSAGGGETDGSRATFDLFSCSAPLSCPAKCTATLVVSWACESERGAPSDELQACWNEYYAGDAPGLLRIHSALDGGGCAYWSALFVHLGDGRAVRQVRETECEALECSPDCDGSSTLHAQEICDVVACPEGVACGEPYIDNCKSLEDELTCDDLEGVLSSRGAGGAGGEAS
jgi:hypothetical protein